MEEYGRRREEGGRVAQGRGGSRVEIYYARPVIIIIVIVIIINMPWDGFKLIHQQL
jgi:hypothetical protein